jgi:acyl carrier protein phosphodiesterase
MNYLAHIYLAASLDEKVILGNFLGDFVKKNTENNYDVTIRQGIHMHRKLDSFTDFHPVFQVSRRRISDKNRRFAGVLIDMFYDHYLARNWLDYSTVSLEDFAEDFYDILERNRSILPDRLKYMMPYLKGENWLLSYGEIPGIEQAVNNVARRFAHSRRPMINPIQELINNYEGLENDFKAFFPEAMVHANQIKSELFY